ncbi:hypothetical protein EDB81DRAFT_812796 [Dactylonectria macrodidyma]|uniref:Uncharacterized protein n=1 Tax=Dactylonectria macrodidyma TaxID=307937 RepID=A0A9P9IL21_9HYPO|nr:hypothetical protein EDB81DRAFT_812796 [Dactylonectria macrodidyma]
MRVLPAFFWISALTPVALSFNFTAPDTSNPVNLSEPVVFKWDTSTGKPIQPWLQIIFATGDSTQTGRWGINLDLINIRNTSTWTWDSPEWVASVNNGSKQILFAGENNWFEATFSSFQDSNDTLSDPLTETEKFEVTGYPNLKDPESGVGATAPSLSLALALGAMALVFSSTA